MADRVVQTDFCFGKSPLFTQATHEDPFRSTEFTCFTPVVGQWHDVNCARHTRKLLLEPVLILILYFTESDHFLAEHSSILSAYAPNRSRLGSPSEPCSQSHASACSSGIGKHCAEWAFPDCVRVITKSGITVTCGADFEIHMAELALFPVNALVQAVLVLGVANRIFLDICLLGKVVSG